MTQSPQHLTVRKKRHIGLIVSLIIASIFLIVAFVFGITGYKFYQQALQVKAHEEQAIASLTVLNDTEKLKDPAALTSAISSAQQHAVAARQITQGKLWDIAQGLPQYGDDIKTVRVLTDVVADLTSTTLPELGTTVANLMHANLSGTNGGLNMQPILDAQNSVQKITDEIQQYSTKIQNRPTPQLEQVRNAYTQASTQFQQINQQFHNVNTMVQGIPTLLGAKGERNYLLVAMTPSEQRSSGGLVGSMGLMTVNNGSINVGEFHSNTEFIPLQTGATEAEKAVFQGPLKMSLDIRDSFAVPDMSRVAELVNHIWQESQYRSQVDGVVAIDPVFIQAMVKINGNVKLDDGRELTGDNTAQFMLHDIYNDYSPQQQDLYFEFLASSIMKSAFSNMNTTKIMQVAKNIGELAQNRHFYAYTFHQDEAQYLQGAGFSKDVQESDVKPAVGVFLNENNPSKLGWFIDRSASIKKVSGNGTAGATYHVTFTLHNRMTTTDLYNNVPYIIGFSPSIAPNGTSVQRMLFYAPKGGSISNLTATGDARHQSGGTLDGKAFTMSDAYIAPGKTVTYEFDVTVSDKAQEQLTLDTSPSGTMAVPVTYEQ